MRKKTAIIALSAGLSVLTTIPALASGWQKNETGWWYGTNADNSTWYSNGWQWIDGNGDGIAECYYFDANGYMAENTVIDGSSVDGNGAWTVNGVVQTKQVETQQNEGPTQKETNNNSTGYDILVLDRNTLKSISGYNFSDFCDSLKELAGDYVYVDISAINDDDPFNQGRKTYFVNDDSVYASVPEVYAHPDQGDMTGVVTDPLQLKPGEYAIIDERMWVHIYDTHMIYDYGKVATEEDWKYFPDVQWS